MADFLPVKLDPTLNELQRFQTGDTVGITAGGTGSATAAGARTALGLAIGTDVQAYSAKLGTLAGWNTNGFMIYNGTTWVGRDLATASSARITITNPSGAAGNPEFDLATVSLGTGGTFRKFSSDAYGRVTAADAVVATDITALVNGVYARIDGATFTGTVTLAGDPASALQAATKQYVDNLFSSGGIPPFEAVVAKTTGNINIASPGATHDGVTLVNGDRLLVGSQTTGSQNGIYVFNGASSALTRAADADQNTEFNPARQVFVQNGTTFKNTGWAVGNSSQPTVGTTPIIFTQVSGATAYTNGNGLDLTGNTFSVVGVAGQISVTGSGVGLASGVVSTGTYTKVTVDTYGRVTAGATATPSDIGAQPSSTKLTNWAAFNANGIQVQTAANTFAARSIATGNAARITVTNADGVSGNPTVDLATTGVGAGTYNSVTVDTYGRVTAGSTVASKSLTETLQNSTGSAVVICRAVYISGNGTFAPANANNISTAKVIGFVAATSIAASASGSITISGIHEATTGQWDAVTGQSGGLTSGAQYYLSNTTAGAITTTAPSSGVHAPIGVAVSSTKLNINVARVVIL